MTTMTISKDLLDQLLDGVQNADDLLGEHGLMKDLKIRMMERMLGAELTAREYPKLHTQSFGYSRMDQIIHTQKIGHSQKTHLFVVK
jgi:hypothetical protein